MMATSSLQHATLPQFPKYSADKQDEVAIVLHPGNRQLTFGQLARRSHFLACAFAARATGPLALPKCATVALVITCEMEAPELLMAINSAGLKAMPIPEALSPSEVARALGSFHHDALFCTHEYFEGVLSKEDSYWKQQADVPPVIVTWGGMTAGQTMSYDDLLEENGGWESADPVALLDRADKLCVDRKQSPFDDFMYTLTSGTTGTPKLVRCTNIGFLPALGHFKTISMLPGAKYFSAQNMAWVSGILGPLASLYNAMPVVLQRGYDRTQYLAAIKQHRPTFLCWTPLVMDEITKMSSRSESDVINSSAQVVMCMGAAFPLPLMKRARKLFPGISFAQGYGSTEAGSVSSLKHDMIGAWLHHVSTHPEAPQVLPTGVVDDSMQDLLRVTITNPETGAEVPHGDVGKVVVRTIFGSNGYLDAPEANSKLFLSGQADEACIPGPRSYITGDLGRVLDVCLDEAQPDTKTRFLILEGRESDVIVTARAWNVNSAEVTQAVSSHPELEGSVVTVAGVEGAGGHQEVCCWIVMRAGKQQVAVDDLVSFLHGRLSDYKIPRWFRFVESLPVNRNGKINMSELRKSFVLEKPQQPRENTNAASVHMQIN